MVWLWLRWAMSLLLQPGGVPAHVAFIMDGNRRFAADHNIKKIDGHRKGYGKMVDAIHWCLELGVQHITVYAFSIDNFSRSLEEVEQLMQLSEDKFSELMQEDGLAERKGVEIRILGDLALAPPCVQGSAARLMQKTAALPAKQAVLNICFSYTSREELVHSMDVLHAGLHSGALQPQDVSPQLLHRCLRTQSSPPVDLLIRTSGETRLSDFLLWQAAHAQLEWVHSMWPQWTFLGFARCILRWQLHARDQQRLRASAAAQIKTSMLHSLGTAIGSTATDSTAADSTATDSTAADSTATDSTTADSTAADRTATDSKSSSGALPMPQAPSTACPVQAAGNGLRIGLLRQVAGLAGVHHECQGTGEAACSDDQYMWDLPRNWAPHRFAPVWHMLGHHLRRLHTRLATGTPATPAGSMAAKVNGTLAQEEGMALAAAGNPGMAATTMAEPAAAMTDRSFLTGLATTAATIRQVTVTAEAAALGRCPQPATAAAAFMAGTGQPACTPTTALAAAGQQEMQAMCMSCPALSFASPDGQLSNKPTAHSSPDSQVTATGRPGSITPSTPGSSGRDASWLTSSASGTASPSASATSSPRTATLQRIAFPDASEAASTPTDTTLTPPDSMQCFDSAPVRGLAAGAQPSKALGNEVPSGPSLVDESQGHAGGSPCHEDQGDGACDVHTHGTVPHVRCQAAGVGTAQQFQSEQAQCGRFATQARVLQLLHNQQELHRQWVETHANH